MQHHKTLTLMLILVPIWSLIFFLMWVSIPWKLQERLKEAVITKYLRTKTRLYGYCPDCGCKRGRTSMICILCGFDHWSR